MLIYSGPVLLKDRSQFFGTQFHFTYSLYVRRPYTTPGSVIGSTKGCATPSRGSEGRLNHRTFRFQTTATVRFSQRRFPVERRIRAAQTYNCVAANRLRFGHGSCSQKIIEVAQSGVRDSNEICRLALTQIGIPYSSD